MKRCFKQISIIQLMVCALVFGFLHPGAVIAKTECDTPDILQKIKNNVDSIVDYQVQATVTLDGKQVSSDISGKPANLMRIKMKIQQGTSSVVITSSFDGSYQWIESKYGPTAEVQKIKLDGLVNPDRPFDTSYYVMSSGVLNGEDYPSSISILLSTYDVKASCTKKEYKLSGPLNIDKFRKYASAKKSTAPLEARVKQYSELFGQITMLFDAKTIALKEYSLSSSDKSNRFTVNFDSLRINQNLSETDFAYQPPKGVKAVDITADLMKQLENN